MNGSDLLLDAINLASEIQKWVSNPLSALAAPTNSRLPIDFYTKRLCDFPGEEGKNDAADVTEVIFSKIFKFP